MGVLQTVKRKAQFAWHYWRLSEHLPYPPSLVSIEATNACNLKCPMCPQAQFSFTKVKLGFMEMDLFRRCVDMAVPFNPKICLNIGGESTLHPELPEMARYAVSQGLFTYVTTNGTKLTPDLSADLIDSGLNRIIVDLDGENPDDFKVMRDNANLDEVTENLQTFLRLKRQKHTQTPEVLIQNLRLARNGQATDRKPEPADYIKTRFNVVSGPH